MNAINLLKQQHKEVEALFGKCEKAEGDRKQEIFFEIADALAVHATIEEKIFYPACKSAGTEDMLEEAVEEHLQIKRSIADLLEMDPVEDRFDAALKVLKEEVLHHAKEEEEPKLFPKVQKLLGADQLEGLGDQMTALMTELLEEGEPRRHVFEELEAPAPL